ncbi:MAG: cupredoxin domain-containing protein [Candidatus Doudnabacteria bacterium]|nr:cupredoxin domain-containing protein [Candidatus Doudnabacteria bacterium]
MTKLIIGIVIIAALVAGGILLFRKSEDNAPPVVPNRSETSENSQVIYSDTGYSPKSLTVRAGTAVVFKNESSGLMWMASAPHPAHTDLPGFDQRTGVPTGQSYSFIFEQPGTWRYHNHLKPSDFGEIIVTP